MNRHKEIHAGFIGFQCFLIRGFIDVGRAGVLDINIVVLKNFPDGEGEAKRVVFFLPSVVDRTRVTSPVCRVLIAQMLYVFPPD